MCGRVGSSPSQARVLSSSACFAQRYCSGVHTMTFPSAFLLCLFTLLPTSSVSTTLLSSLLSTASPIQTRSILGAKAILTDSDQIQTFVQQLASSRRPVVITGLDPTLLDVDKLNPTPENPLYDFNVNNVRVLTLQVRYRKIHAP